ncbi:MAG: site-specific integrase, partial [Ruminococcus sp.]|nr:site-specific integrase [Ruminococcus sp.]
MKNNQSLGYHITKYFAEYLPQVKGLSQNTICSYRDAIVIFLDYLHDVKKLNINKLKVDSVDEKMVEEFLNYLETERGNCTSTRNQRLAAIHSFYSYIQKRELSCFDLCSRILSIETKPTPSTTVSYFSVDETIKLINCPKTETKYGFRDYTLLLFMYETAARGQEICDLKLEQLYLTKEHPKVILKGKGNKERETPLTDDLRNILIKYIMTFKIKENEIVFRNRKNKKLTKKGIEYILLKYINQCREKYPDQFRGHYSNHSVRHSRAMHLLESGVNLMYLRDFLGHSSYVTTEIYAKTNPVIKEKHILDHSQKIGAEDRYSENEKKDLLSFLKEI